MKQGRENRNGLRRGDSRADIFMHSGDLLSTDNNDTSNEQNQFDYKASVVGTSRLGEIKAKDQEVMAAGTSVSNKAVVEFHFTGCGRPSDTAVPKANPSPPAGGFVSSSLFPLKGNEDPQQAKHETQSQCWHGGSDLHHAH